MKTLFLSLIIIGLVSGGVVSLYPNEVLEKTARGAWDEINEYREKAGKEALAWDYELETLAIAHSQWMKDTGNYQHSKHQYSENIAWCPTGCNIAKLWYESPAHKSAMMDSSIQSGAVGVVGEYSTFMAR